MTVRIKVLKDDETTRYDPRRSHALSRLEAAKERAVSAPLLPNTALGPVVSGQVVLRPLIIYAADQIDGSGTVTPFDKIGNPFLAVVWSALAS